jgi:hydroxymethylpyrimidine/phosphomethylpyrimidine kinase
MSILRERLLPLIGWITPNLEELALLLDEPVGSAADVPRQAARLQQMAARDGNSELRVVVTGGELERPNDYFLDAARSGSTGGWVKGERVRTAATHGTGCAFSSALLCQLVHGVGAKEAVIHAKVYVTEALRLAYPIGGGKGPMHHLFQY